MELLFKPAENEKEYEDFCKLVFLKVIFLLKNKILFANDENL